MKSDIFYLPLPPNQNLCFPPQKNSLLGSFCFFLLAINCKSFLYLKIMVKIVSLNGIEVRCCETLFLPPNGELPLNPKGTNSKGLFKLNTMRKRISHIEITFQNKNPAEILGFCVANLEGSGFFVRAKTDLIGCGISHLPTGKLPVPSKL